MAIARQLVAAVIVASVCGFGIQAAAATRSDAFDQLTYREVTRNLTIVIRGQTYETHADGLAKIPDALRELFSRLDALYRWAIRAEGKWFRETANCHGGSI